MLAGKALEGVFYVLRTGCQWKALPREYGSGSTVRRTFPKWLAAGFFEKPKVWKKSLRSHTLFSTAFANRSFVLRKKPPIIWPWFNWPAPVLSGRKLIQVHR
ncbi:MAG: transposase [Oscillospiraceae bacterium]|nr:transposase [Oscillospiraceae bacterium]